MYSFYDPSQKYLYLGLFFTLLSIGLFMFKKNKLPSIIVLIIGAFFLRIFASMLDPFLNLWDERIHALVAKHMMEDPFNPMLYKETPLPYEMNNWVGNHIWLHKQPFFMWLEALSMKAFGVSEFSFRLPSVLLSTLSVFGVYKIGKNVVNQPVGYLGALFASSSFITLNLVSGFETTDQNDVVFASLITLSIWCYTEFIKKEHLKWALFAGTLSGLAVLTKWAVGLLVFAPWGAVLIWLLIQKKGFIKHFNGLLVALGACLVIFLPWQIYCALSYPAEYWYNYYLTQQHFSTAVHGHDGDWTYHFDKIGYMYYNFSGYVLFFILSLASLIYLAKNAKGKTVILTSIFVVYFFFTLVATKMPMFTYVVSSFVYLGLGSVLYLLYTFFRSKVDKYTLALKSVALCLLVYFTFDFIRLHYLEKAHSEKYKSVSNWFLMTEEKNGIVELKEKLGEGKYVILNTRPHSQTSFYFYTGFPSYPGPVKSFQISLCKEKGYKVVVLYQDGLPEEIKQRKDVIFYDFPMW